MSVQLHASQLSVVSQSVRHKTDLASYRSLIALILPVIFIYFVIYFP